jgi:hypothetical protein
VSSAHNIEQLDLLSAQLDDILQTVVLALDTDEVTEDGFHSFSFLWDVCTRKIKEHKKAFLKQT